MRVLFWEEPVRWSVAIGGLLALSLAAMAEEPDYPVLKGALGIHDPSVALIDGMWVGFGTGVEHAPDGGAIRIKTSPDGATWTDKGTLGKGLPDWVPEILGRTPPNLWAPSVFVGKGEVLVYFAASLFGKNISAIGLFANPDFDPKNPGSGWEDRGVVMTSAPGDNFNAIDPFRFDTSDGRSFLAFGSWWDGIKMVELDPQAGMRIAPDSEVLPLASRRGGAIEAPGILEHAGRYYLFVSFDHCCRGIASDYNIRVGRADDITGPYVDRDGKPMLEGGGTTMAASHGKYKGPGGAEPFHGPDGAALLAFHYYDANYGGRPMLQIVPIGWDNQGWPVLGAN